MQVRLKTATKPVQAHQMILLLPLLAVTLPAQTPSPTPTPAILADGCTGPMSDTRLNVVIGNVRSARGVIAVSLYADDPKRFLAKRGSLYVGRVPAVAGVTRMCIHLPSTGTYGLAIYHDEDGDRKFKRSAIGLPAEGYAFSNNAPTIFGLPSFGRVRFKVPRSGFETAAKLKYP